MFAASKGKQNLFHYQLLQVIPADNESLACSSFVQMPNKSIRNLET